MRQSRRFHLKGLLASAGLVASAPYAVAATKDLIGTWSGRLTLGSASLRLKLIIAEDKTVTLISVDQGGARIPASSVAIDGTKLALKFKAVNASYDGVLKDKDHLEGTFTQGAAAPLNFTRGELADLPLPAAQPLTLEALQKIRAASATPALGGAWQKAGKAPRIIVNGARSAEDEIAVQPEDQWHWGSITKSMTATLVARLVEAGVVTWQTTVNDVLGPKDKDIQASYLKANFLHLLSHRAGLQPNLDMLSLLLYSRDPLPDARTERLKYALAALKQTPEGAPGEKMIYANNGYVVAGAMLETVTGKSWEDLITAHVFVPLKLTSAGFGAPGREGQIDQPLGHAGHKPYAVKPGATTDNPVVLGPAGRVHMNLADMLTYLEAHRDQPADFLKPASWQTLHTPPFGGEYALGWVVRDGGVLWHNGSNTLWYAEVMVDAKSGLVCAAAGNAADPNTMKAVGEVLLSAKAAAL